MSKPIAMMLIIALGIIFGWYIMQSESIKHSILELFTINKESTATVDTTESVSNNKPYLRDRKPTEMPIIPTESHVQLSYQGHAVTLTQDGLVPRELTVSKGTTVRFVNQSRMPMQIMTDLHPDHSLLPEFVMKTTLGTGGSYDFTFERVGTWRYHNESSLTDTGTIIVVESVQTK